MAGASIPTRQKSIADTFILALFTFNLAVAVAGASLLLFLSYRQDRQEFDHLLDAIHHTLEQGISSSLFHGNREVTEGLMRGVAQAPGISEIRVVRADGAVLTVGASECRRPVEHSHALVYGGQDRVGQTMGEVRITACLDDLVDAQWSRVGFLFALLFVVALLTAFFSSFLYQRFVGRHLHALARYARQITPDTLDQQLLLDRPTSEDTGGDELSSVESAFNRMREGLRQTLLALRKREAQYNIIVSSSGDGITQYDREGRMLFANPVALDRIGASTADEIAGRCFCDLLYPDPEQCRTLDAGVQRVIATGQTQTVEFHHTRHGRVTTLEFTLAPHSNDQGAVESVVGVARDVTLRKQHEEILEQSFRSMPIGMVLSEIESGLLFDVNDMFVAMTGFSRKEAIGSTSVGLGFITAEQRRDLVDRLTRQGYVQNIELEMTRADGRRLCCLYSAELIATRHGRKLLSVFQDVTEQRQQEAERRILERQIRQANKLEAIGTLAGGIAHDFNNILAAILGYGQMALEKLDPNDPVRAHIQQIIKAGDRATDLIRQILSFSRQESAEAYRPVRLQNLLGEMLKMLRASLPATIAIDARIGSHCRPVLGEATQLHQVFMNLCTNAKQAIGRNNTGAIAVTLEETEVGEPLAGVDGGYIQPGSYLLVTVSDTGCGIEPRMQARIFDPFFTTKEVDEGTGLGLALALGIILKHGGGITLESRPGQGTTFRVYLPATEDENDTEVRETRVPVGGRERLVIVDDEQAILDLLDMGLSRLGYQVRTFPDPREALRSLESSPLECDLVITDLSMPSMSGLALADEVHRIMPRTPIILHTGNSEDIEGIETARFGVRLVVMKPIVTQELARTIREVLDSA